MAVNGFIWCAVGLLVGGFVAASGRRQGLAWRIETVAVAIFGAFIGGEFVASALNAGGDSAFHGLSLLLAVGGAALMLGLLSLMRRSVGPLRPHKVRRRR